MNTKKVLLLLFFSSCISAAPGCMDISYHLEKPFDSKNYHLVLRRYGNVTSCCSCPCKRISLARGRCLECEHFRYLQPGIIVESDEQGTAPGKVEKHPAVNALSLQERALMRTFSESIHKK